VGALGENFQLASPYELNWNHTIDVTAGIDAIPQAAHLSESNIFVKPVTLFADTVQNRVQALVLGGLEVTGSLWEKLLGFSSIDQPSPCFPAFIDRSPAKICKLPAAISLLRLLTADDSRADRPIDG
jgi:hypothetical protein